MSYVRLTATGYDFLDSIRDRDVWEETKQRLSKVGGAVALSVLLEIAKQIVKEKLGLNE